MYNTDKAIITFKSIRGISLNSLVVFVLAIIPAAIGIHSFFRYEDFSTLAHMKLYMPDFSWESLIRCIQSQTWEYYRPVSNIIYWLGYLVAGNNPFKLHVLFCAFYGLNMVCIYIIGRFFSGELTGWLSALLCATFAPVVVISWWTGTGGNFPASFLFHLALVVFLYAPAKPLVSVPVALFLFLCTFFYKESFIILSPLLLGFCIMDRRFQTKPHMLIALIAPVLAGIKILIANSLIGSTLNEHVHLNILEIAPAIIWGNFSDYARLLIYGHNYVFVILGLLSTTVLAIKSDKLRTLALLGVIIVVVSYRFLYQQMWLMEWMIILLVLYYAWKCTRIEKVWLLWIALGLVQVLFWDLRIVGGIMNRLIIQSSFGFALFLGFTLTPYIRSIYQTIQPYVRIQSRAALYPDLRAHFFKTTYAALIIVFLLFGIREEVTSLGMKQIGRERAAWIKQGQALETVIQYLVRSLSEKALLIVITPSLSGMQTPTQMGDALILFDRPDIETTFMNEHYIPALKTYVSSPDFSSNVYVVSSHELTFDAKAESFINQHLLFAQNEDEYISYIYRIDFD